jgi:hypothetical protein
MFDATVSVYAQLGCAACHPVVAFLRTSACRSNAPQALQELLALASTAPPPTVINGQVVVGCEPRRLRELLGLPGAAPRSAT